MCWSGSKWGVRERSSLTYATVMRDAVAESYLISYQNWSSSLFSLPLHDTQRVDGWKEQRKKNVAQQQKMKTDDGHIVRRCVVVVFDRCDTIGDPRARWEGNVYKLITYTTSRRSFGGSEIWKFMCRVELVRTDGSTLQLSTVTFANAFRGTCRLCSWSSCNLHRLISM